MRKKGRRSTLLNRHAVSARRGLILSEAAGTGKTTAITQFGKLHEAADQARHPHRNDRIPVLCATVPPAATPCMLAAEFARFLGLPVTQRVNLTGYLRLVLRLDPGQDRAEVPGEKLPNRLPASVIGVAQ
ncbi:TniB family NTP-binding protein [Nocardia brasiliensis]|uniref:TniB family NTP-binding protein n=1 Tax=Nocardia brasiliensis TaxID=37326 RepID=UPI0024562111|nr:TniB family NTP-binding protein [Nocardia brasiliensis]